MEPAPQTLAAEITDFQTTTHKDDDGSTMTLYAPEYTYSFNGKTYVHSSNTYTSSTSYNVGDRVPILIDPERPEKMRVKSAQIIGFLVACGFLIFLLISGIILLIS